MPRARKPQTITIDTQHASVHGVNLKSDKDRTFWEVKLHLLDDVEELGGVLPALYKNPVKVKIEAEQLVIPQPKSKVDPESA